MKNEYAARLLIIDDEKGIRTFLSYELSQRGYAVDVAADGEEGLEKIKSGHYDLVISDIMMPKVNGLQVLQVVKKTSPETEVIIMTGYATIENSLQAMRDGAYDFVQKPFNSQELFSLVEKALEKTELKALVAVYEGSQAIFSTLKIEKLFPIMIMLLKKALRADEVAIILDDHQQQLYLAAASFPLSEYTRKELYLQLSKKLSASSQSGTDPLIVEMPFDAHPLLSGVRNAIGIKTLAGSPIVLGKKVFGFIWAARTSGTSDFTRHDARSLSIFVSLIAQSLANTKLYEQLEIKIAELEETNGALNKIKKTLSVVQHKGEGVLTRLEKLTDFITKHADNISAPAGLSGELKKYAVKIAQDSLECKEVLSEVAMLVATAQGTDEEEQDK